MTSDIAYDLDQVKNNRKINQAWFMFQCKVYNVTQYLMKGDLYLRDKANRLIINHLGEDAMALLMKFKDMPNLVSCFDTPFCAGTLEEEYTITCRVMDIMIIVSEDDNVHYDV
jgi:hypothetical protein